MMGSAWPRGACGIWSYSIRTRPVHFVAYRTRTRGNLLDVLELGVLLYQAHAYGLFASFLAAVCYPWQRPQRRPTPAGPTMCT